MIFQHTHEWIWQPSPHTGELKVMTRRLVKPDDIENHWHIGGEDDTTLNEVCRGPRGIYVVGKTYAVQPGRGEYSVGRIRITSIQREDVRDISDEDARAEGFDSREDFWDTWVSMHDKSWHKTYLYAVDMDYLRDYGFYRRPAKRYDAWVLTFEPVPS